MVFFYFLAAFFNRFIGFEPDRELRSWGTLSDAIEYYAQSRVSNLIEHELLDIKNIGLVESKYIELKNYATEVNRKINKNNNFSDDFVVDPDVYGYFLSKIK